MRYESLAVDYGIGYTLYYLLMQALDVVCKVAMARPAT